MMDEPQDREITLSVGRMFALFMGLVLLCGMFFVIGYSLGKSSQHPEGTLITDVVPSGGSGTRSEPSSAPSKPADTSATPGSASPQDMTFYKAIQQSAPDTHLPPATPEARPQAPPAASAPEAPSAAGAGYRVQVAAVSRQEDATVLRDALQRKGYPATITSGPGDALFHVQVGPYSEVKDAEQARARLIADGYNPILKR